jgi:chemotaxis protein MotB
VSAGGFNDRRRRRRGGGGGGGHEGGDERWLLTYADMITLLMALFMVLFSISAVNISKYESLQQSLRAAFSGHVTPGGKVMPGGEAVMLPGAKSSIQGIQASTPSLPSDPEFTIQPTVATSKAMRAAAAREQDRLARVRAQIEAYAHVHGFAGRIATSIDERGLEIRLLTDKALFASGDATLEPSAAPLMRRVAELITQDGVRNQVSVEGNTDSVPISTSHYHNNWELSTARATAVLEALLADGVPANRLSATGYADQRPVAPNSTADGRAANRRVDVVLLRQTTTSH